MMKRLAMGLTLALAGLWGGLYVLGIQANDIPGVLLTNALWFPIGYCAAKATED